MECVFDFEYKVTIGQCEALLHQGYLRKNVFDENPYKVVQWSHVGVTDKSFLCIVAVPPVCQLKGVKVCGMAKISFRFGL